MQQFPHNFIHSTEGERKGETVSERERFTNIHTRLCVRLITWLTSTNYLRQVWVCVSESACLSMRMSVCVSEPDAEPMAKQLLRTSNPHTHTHSQSRTLTPTPSHAHLPDRQDTHSLACAYDRTCGMCGPNPTLINTQQFAVAAWRRLRCLPAFLRCVAWITVMRISVDSPTVEQQSRDWGQQHFDDPNSLMRRQICQMANAFWQCDNVSSLAKTASCQAFPISTRTASFLPPVSLCLCSDSRPTGKSISKCEIHFWWWHIKLEKKAYI